MFARFLIPALLFVVVIGCGKELTQEAQQLKESSPDVYNKIMAMSDDELDAAILETRTKLRIVRSKLPRSIAGVSVGGKTANDSKPDVDEAPAVEGVDTVGTFAIPLEVMMQEQESRK